MKEENHIPTREVKDYKNLSRSVVQNHAKSEFTKPKEHISKNMLDNFLKSHWISWIFHYLKSRFGPRHLFQTYKESTDKGIYRLQSKNDSKEIKIALVADWATDTVESRNISRQIRKHNPDYSIHLGDTYFVGAPFEIKNNFSPGDSFWHYGSIGSFALPGNHEMYSNGNPYFDTLLPWMGIYRPERIIQKASYFCLENPYWRIIGLDTGYRSVGIPIFELLFSKADLKKEVILWLKNDLHIQEDNRGLVLLTHHQYISSFDKYYPRAAKQLSKLISPDRKVLWLWGHEHRFSMYGKYAAQGSITAYGRCIGHGGMPVSLFKETWLKKIKERGLVLFDNRVCKKIGNTNVGHNGYTMLTIRNEELHMDYYDESSLLVNEQWTYDRTSKTIEGKKATNYCSELTQHQPISQVIQ